jgi:hypothetical protein
VNNHFPHVVEILVINHSFVTMPYLEESFLPTSLLGKQRSLAHHAGVVATSKVMVRAGVLGIFS